MYSEYVYLTAANVCVGLHKLMESNATSKLCGIHFRDFTDLKSIFVLITSFSVEGRPMSIQTFANIIYFFVTCFHFLCIYVQASPLRHDRSTP